MANQTAGNPKVFDTTGTIDGTFGLVLIQWIDNAADIADDADLVFVMNNVTHTHKIALTANELGNTCVYQLGPFATPMRCTDFSVTTIDAGELHVWVS